MLFGKLALAFQTRPISLSMGIIVLIVFKTINLNYALLINFVHFFNPALWYFMGERLTEIMEYENNDLINTSITVR